MRSSHVKASRAMNTLARGRDGAEELMVDAVIIHRPTGGLDEGDDYAPVQDPVYAGKAKVQTYEPNEQTPEVGGGTVTVQRYKVHLPVGAYKPATKDVITVLTCQLDENLVGRRFVVQGLLHKPYATAYRLACDDIGAYGRS